MNGVAPPECYAVFFTGRHPTRFEKKSHACNETTADDGRVKAEEYPFRQWLRARAYRGDAFRSGRLFG